MKQFLKEQNIDPKSKEGIGIFKEYNKIQDKLKKELENLKSKVIDISNNDIEINSENIDNIIVRMYKEYEI